MLMQRPPCARVPASATTACPAQGWQAPAVIWSWCEVGECSVASQTGSRCGALSPAGTGSADKCPWGGRGRHRGALPPPYSSGSRAGSSGSAFQGGKMTPDREAITPSRAQSCIHSTDVYEQPRMWGHSGEPGGLGRGMGQPRPCLMLADPRRTAPCRLSLRRHASPRGRPLLLSWTQAVPQNPWGEDSASHSMGLRDPYPHLHQQPRHPRGGPVASRGQWL